MPVETDNTATRLPVRPTCSIILPVYNRANFLPDAIDAITRQHLADWELICVDDGSTDDTRQVFESLTADLPQPVRYIYRENGGAYAARNTGLDHARGRYIAFYDSDDIWLDHHLQRCVEALEEYPTVDWVYAACRMIDMESGTLILENTFYDENDRPRPFFKAKTQPHGPLHIIDDGQAPAIAIRYGFYNGLQNSVIRAEVFDGQRFRTHLRNEAEDQMFAIRTLLAGHRMARFNEVHVVYRVHGGNSSAAATDPSLERKLAINQAVALGFEELLDELTDERLKRVTRRRLIDEYFWKQGYALLWESGRKDRAIEKFRRGLGHWRWCGSAWKTYLAARVRRALAA